jgi:hypothetical protein
VFYTGNEESLLESRIIMKGQQGMKFCGVKNGTSFVRIACTTILCMTFRIQDRIPIE